MASRLSGVRNPFLLLTCKQILNSIMKLSVIVPVYNVEVFLPRCLDSLLRQGMGKGEYEVICVNDGSGDSSGAILEKYEQAHPDVIRTVTQENQGQSVARNVGLHIAQGEYVTFVDADDYVVDGAYRYMMDHFCPGEDLKEDWDVLHFNYKSVYTDGKSVLPEEQSIEGVVTCDGDGTEVYRDAPSDMAAVWTKIYRHAFLNQHHIQFNHLVKVDQLFNYDVFCHHPRLRMVSCNAYRYERMNDSSIMTTLDKGQVLEQLKQLSHNNDVMHQRLEAKEFEDMAPVAKRIICGCSFIIAKKMAHVHLTYKEWRSMVKLLRLKDIASVNCKYEHSMKARLAMWLMEQSLYSYMIQCLTAFLFRDILKGRLMRV